MTVLATLSLVIWLYLCLFHGKFWHSDQLLNFKSINKNDLPAVMCVIPARDEAESIGKTVRSLLDQDYSGGLSIVVVDDNSTDGTSEAVRAVLRDGAEEKRVHLIEGKPLEDGWVGKMWAVSQGVETGEDADYLLFTDADIAHAPGNVAQLVSMAEDEGLGLVSMMVRLRCVSVWERLLIPAFIYFFQKLYPFPRVNAPNTNTAAAAGGCMLVHAGTLRSAGGIAAIRDKVIDDCALARLIKPHRPVWLGLTEETRSLRAYEELAPIWRMVTRTAYVQLDHNPLWLFGTVAGMVILYLVPPLALVSGMVSGDAAVSVLGGSVWLVMAWTYLPTLDLYRLNAGWTLALPLAGILYVLMTLDSARLHYQGRGGAWKGRTYP